MKNRHPGPVAPDLAGETHPGARCDTRAGPRDPAPAAEERNVSKNEADCLIVRVARPLDAETPVQEFAS